MAIAKDSSYNHLRGKVKKTFVVKHYPSKIVLTSYPDMSNVIFSELQHKSNSKFAVAAAYASSILKDPEKKANEMLRLNCLPNQLYHLLVRNS